MSTMKSNIFDTLNSDSDRDSDNDNNTSKNLKETAKKNKSTIKTTKKSSKSTNNDNKTDANTNKFEEEVMNQFYGKKIVYNKPYKNNNYHNDNNNYYNNNKSENNYKYENNNESVNNNDFIKVVNKKKDSKTLIECKFKNIEDNLEDIKMDNYFKVLAHHNDDKSWDFNSYYNMCCLKTWGDMGTFFNSVFTAKGECNYTDFDLFVMKNEISPMWEDKENRNGSICSIKIDSLTDGNEIFKNLIIHMGNNTLLKFNPSTWNAVNGISLSSKKLDNNTETYCIIIKLWFKINILNYPSVDKLLNDDINQQINKYSIKNKPIKPEY